MTSYSQGEEKNCQDEHLKWVDEKGLFGGEKRSLVKFLKQQDNVEDVYQLVRR